MAGFKQTLYSADKQTDRNDFGRDGQRSYSPCGNFEIRAENYLGVQMDILVVLEENRGILHRMSREAIAGAQKLASKMNLSVSALAIGENADTLANEVANTNIQEILVVKNDLVASYNADGYAETVKQIIGQESPKIIIVGHTYQTRDYFPRVSAKLDIPFIPDIIGVQPGDDPVFNKSVFNAKLAADLTAETEQVLISFQSAAYSEDEIESGKPLTREISINLDSAVIRSESEQPFQDEAGEIDLESAEIIVSVGRGIEKEENLPIAFDFAKAVGGEIASSRPVVDSGWLPLFRQIGSSGQNVSPKLYFALGISGAIQHVVGMKGSKNIIAVNKDSSAPIFEIADYAVVGDLLEIIPKLTLALQAEKD